MEEGKDNCFAYHEYIQLYRLFAQKKREQPKFIGCQYNVLDRGLRVVTDDKLGGKKHRSLSSIRLSVKL